MSENRKVKVDVKTDPLPEETDEEEHAEEARIRYPRMRTKTLKESWRTRKQEAKETYDRFLRVSAEFENYKKRTRREVDDFRKYANEALIKELLTVVDNLERAMESSQKASAKTINCWKVLN